MVRLQIIGTMHIELIFLLPVITTLVCACVLLCKPGRLIRSHRVLVVSMLMVAICIFLFSQFFNDYLIDYPFLIVAYSAALPLSSFFYYVSVRLLTSTEGLKKMDYFHFIFVAFIELLNLIFFFYLIWGGKLSDYVHLTSKPTGGWAEMFTLPGGFHIATAQIVFSLLIVLQIASVFIWSTVLITRYIRNLSDVFATPEDRYRYASATNIASIGVVFIAFLFLVFLYTGSFYNPWFSAFVCILSSILQIVLTWYAYHVDFSAEDVQKMLDEADTAEPPVKTTEEPSQFAELIERFNRLIEEEKPYLDPDLTLVSLSQQLGTNRTYTSRILQEHFNTTFSDFVNQYRIKYAIQLMRDTPECQFNIPEIANQSGYSSEQSFYRNFKKLMNQTPTVWYQHNVAIFAANK